MATSTEIESSGSGISGLVYALLIIILLGIVIIPPVVAGKLRPSVKK